MPEQRTLRVAQVGLSRMGPIYGTLTHALLTGLGRVQFRLEMKCMVAFVRRFDESNIALKDSIDAGDCMVTESVQIDLDQSRLMKTRHAGHWSWNPRSRTASGDRIAPEPRKTRAIAGHARRSTRDKPPPWVKVPPWTIADFPRQSRAVRSPPAQGILVDAYLRCFAWDLPADVIEERRLVFWECYTIDTFQAHCFSRPPLMRANHFDTALPRHISEHSEVLPDGSVAYADFKGMKYEIVKILARLLDLMMDITLPPYDHVNAQYEAVCAFERSIPFHLRCRHAMVATISRYPTPEAAVGDSPAPNRRDLRRTFEQFTLAMHVCEAILFLQRPYFVRAMNESPDDPVLSQHGASFLAVVERCNAVTQIVRGLTELFPSVASRHWFYWYHLFNAAVCVATLVLRCPQSPMAPFAMTVLDEAISAYSVVTRANPSPTLNANHDRLLKLRRRSAAKMSAGLAPPGVKALQPGAEEGEQEKADQHHVDEGLLGWRTRLIERGTSHSGQQRATTIDRRTESPGAASFMNGMSMDVDGGSGVLDATPPFLSMLFMDTHLPSTDLMMHQHIANMSDFREMGNIGEEFG